MTSISSVNTAALLILQRATLTNEDDTTSATDRITAIVNGVSSEDSAVKTQASSKINSGLLDVQQANDSIISQALDFLDSDGFKSSDPSIKDALKQLIGEKSGEFSTLFKIEKSKNSGVTDENAMANAVQGMIRSNRDKFTDDEFVIGFQLSNGAQILANIEDINGNSTHKTLSERHSANMKESGANLEAFLEAVKDPTKLGTAELKRLDEASTSAWNSVMAGIAENLAWADSWGKAFGLRSIS